MERKMAHIEKILSINPIPNADAIEVAEVLGWKCVVKKGEFKPGDLCVYCEVDSVMPMRPEFEFLRQRNFRIKTIKLKKQVSQGICFPLSILDGLAFENDVREFPVYSWKEGEDVTVLLGVEKWEEYIPACLRGVILGKFPNFLHKTDETRLQAVPRTLQRHADKTFYVTEKIDGSSMTVYIKDGVFGVCSRNLDLAESETNAYWKVARELKLEEKMRCTGLNLCLQGELHGIGIQGNKYQLSAVDGLKFALFNVYNIDSGEYFSFLNFTTFADENGIQTVPILETNFKLKGTVDEMVEYAKGFSTLNNKVFREGIVIRTAEPVQDEELGRLSFKVINPDFLLKFDSE